MDRSTAIIFKGQSNVAPFEEIIVEWHDIINDEIPKINWTQIHVIANYNGKVVTVSKITDGHLMIHVPGGHIEKDEAVETTLNREFFEETGGTIIRWKPIGYQKRTDSSGNETHQLRVYAKVKDIKFKTIDFDGRVSEVKCIDISDLLDVLDWNNPVGHRILELINPEFMK